MAIKNELIVFFTAWLPVAELRGAIPLGLSLGLGTLKVFFLALIGNLIPVAPLLIFYNFLVKEARQNHLLNKYLHWWFERVEKKSELVAAYGFWGLILFVAIPLPVTGAWTAAAIASLLELDKRKSFFAILIGVFIAGIVVTLATKGVIKYGAFLYR